MDMLHRFLGRVLPIPETGFSSTAPDLAHQLQNLLGSHVASFVPDLLGCHGFNPERPKYSEKVIFKVQL